MPYQQTEGNFMSMDAARSSRSSSIERDETEYDSKLRNVESVENTTAPETSAIKGESSSQPASSSQGLPEKSDAAGIVDDDMRVILRAKIQESGVGKLRVPEFRPSGCCDCEETESDDDDLCSTSSDDSEESYNPFGSGVIPPVLPVQIQSNPRVTILKEHKMRSRSMPLENGSAEETALRVIRECLADDLYSDDLDYIANIEAVQNCDGDGYGGAGSLQNKMTGQGCFSPKWQSSHKWVKVLISPMMSRNRVFPSRSKEVRKGKGSSKRLTRFPSSDWSRKDANDDKLSPHWRKQAKTGSKTTIRSSVLSWLQPDAAKPRPKKQKQMELCTSSSSSCGMSHSGFTDPWLKDLITVGHLHEIAEEHEIFSDDEADNLESINSFGKFLLIAAQRQPKAGLTRISSATF